MSQENVEIVGAAAAATNACDLDRYLALWAPDVELILSVAAIVRWRTLPDQESALKAVGLEQ